MNKILKDVLVCGAICAIALVAYWDSLGLPPPQYDPLGAGTLPRLIVVGIICLSLVAVGQSVLRQFLAPGRARPADKPRDFVLRPWLAVAVFFYTLLFAMSLELRIPYWISSVVFLFLSIMTISRFRRSAALSGAIVAVSVGLFVYFLFTRVFHVDLP